MLIFALVLVVCSVMVIRQISRNQGHWTVSKELERRSWTAVERALKLAEEP